MISPIPDNEHERLHALRSYDILDTAPEKEFDDLVELASVICKTPIALISLVDENRQWFKSKKGLDAMETSREISFCQHAIMDKNVYEINDASKNQTFASNPLVTGAPDIRFYAGAPLSDEEGYNLGTLCVIDKVPKQLDEEQKKALQTLAAEVSLRFQLRRLNKRLENDNVKLRNFYLHFKHSKELKCILDPITFEIIEFNAQFVNATEQKEDHILGQSFLNYIEPGDLEKTRTRLQEAIASDTNVVLENRFTTKNEKSNNFSWNIFHADNKLFINGQNINLRIKHDRQSRAYKNFFDMSMDLVCIAAIDGYFKKINKQFTEVFEYTEKELLSKPFIEFIHPDDKAKTLEVIGQLIDGGNLIQFENRVITKSNETKWLQWSASANAQDGSLYAIAHDVTNRKVLNNELIESKTLAEQSAKTQKEFLANMSHEIRTPLNGIIGFTDLVLETNLSQTQLKYLKYIKYSGESLLAIINDILDHSKLEAGEVNVEEIDFNLNNRLDTLVSISDLKAKESETQLTFNLDSNVPKNLNGDPFRLNQIILNVLSNAVKFTKNGKVDLSVNVNDKSNDDIIWLNFVIEDDGIGISEEALKVIFDPFKQAENNTSREFGGTGLGLTIVKRLTQLLGGEIHVESTLGKGTKFTIELPFKASALNVDASATLNESKTRSLKGLKILVAEDNPVNQALLESRLSLWGCEYTLVNNGLKAVELSEKTRYDIILMDIQMPEMDGYSAAKAIKSNSKNLSFKSPIIALTAQSLGETLIKAKKVGMTDYVTKPFNPNDLYETIFKNGKLAYSEALSESLVDPVNTVQNLQYVNLSEIESLALGDKAFVKKLITLFLENFDEFVSTCMRAVESNNYDLIQAQIHRMKPSVHMIGANGLLNMMEDLNNLTLNKASTAEMSEVLDSIITRYGHIFTELKEILNNIK